jgi:hypothetical protein
MVDTMLGPMVGVPGFEAMKAQQQAFLKAMSGAWPAPTGPEAERQTGRDEEELADIRRQLSELSEKMAKMSQKDG